MKFVILGTLPGLNEYISAERSNRHSAAKMKKQTEYAIGMIARSQHRKAHFKRPVVMRYLWVEKDRRRDLDNVAFAKKIHTGRLRPRGHFGRRRPKAYCGIYG